MSNAAGPARSREALRLAARLAGPLVAVSVLGACASLPEPAGGGPLTWVRYVSGDDLRAQCRPAEPTRLRMIHTVPGSDRIRTFDLRETTEGARLETRSILVGELSRLSADAPLGQLRPDGPEVVLSRPQFAALVAAVKVAGLRGRAGTRASLPTGSYWFANGCHQGEWFVGIVAARQVVEEAALPP
ncbi:hypothetical protein [Arenibaculum pallidiluteum]|uniref:hypothetical protein n=1 Tax=Arenibaculum pallidiluteum TaxID=2812559 RepID=UPI001A968D53|nr:hypothetical protein [Arenibaculum pallidiluteum]